MRMGWIRLNSVLRILKVMRFMVMALSSWSAFFFYALWHSFGVFSHHILCLCICICFWFSINHFLVKTSLFFWDSISMLFDFCFFSLLHLMVLSDAFGLSVFRVHMLDKDLCVVSSCGDHLLASLVPSISQS